MPLMVAILARAILRSPLPGAKLAGIAVGLIGVTVIYSDRLGWSTETSGLGIAAVLLSVFFASLSSVVLKWRSPDVDPMTLLVVPFFVAGALVSGVGAAVEGADPRGFTAAAWGPILYLAILGSFVAFGLYFWAIQRMDVTLLSYQTFIIPLLALIIGWVVLGEAVSKRVAMGTVLILGGITLANFNKLRPRPRSSGKTPS
jgi:drug/metabolite transporter (DMT)-like permease